MHIATGLLADTSSLATSTSASPSIGWQTLIVATVGIAGLAAIFAIVRLRNRLTPVKVRKE